MIEFTSSSVVYMDTNIVIYFLEDRAQFQSRAKAFVFTALNAGARLVTSELTVAECIYRPHRDRNAQSISLYEAAFRSGLLGLYPLTGDLVIRAAKEGGSLGLKLIDTVHYLSALEAGCDYFATADRKFKSSQYLEIVGI